MSIQKDHDILIRVDSQIEDIHRRLFGNGQPGQIEKLANLTSKLEDFKNRFLGALLFLTFSITLLGGIQIYHLLTGR